MEKIAQFYKVSEEQFINDWRAATGSSIEEAKSVYANIRLPRRATKGSAGYDFFAPESFTLVPHETILIPTGIRVMIEDGWVLSFTRARVWASVIAFSSITRSASSTATISRQKTRAIS